MTLKSLEQRGAVGWTRHDLVLQEVLKVIHLRLCTIQRCSRVVQYMQIAVIGQETNNNRFNQFFCMCLEPSVIFCGGIGGRRWLIGKAWHRSMSVLGIDAARALAQTARTVVHVSRSCLR